MTSSLDRPASGGEPTGNKARNTYRPCVLARRSGFVSGSPKYWQAIDGLRVQLNDTFYLGLADFEAHFAVYPPGVFYKRHLDQSRSSGQRMISCILYLNRDWQAHDGGLLRIYTVDSDDYVDVLPEMGTFVCFRSDIIHHEVLPSNRERLSFTGWLRRQV